MIWDLPYFSEKLTPNFWKDGRISVTVLMVQVELTLREFGNLAKLIQCLRMLMLDIYYDDQGSRIDYDPLLIDYDQVLIMKTNFCVMRSIYIVLWYC